MENNLPLLVKLALFLFIISVLILGIYIGQDILLPLGFSFLIAILLVPLEQFLRRKKVPRVLSIIFSLLLSFIAVIALFVFISYQLSNFVSDADGIKKNLLGLLDKSQAWISNTFHLSKQQQQQMVQQAQGDSTANAKAIAGGALGFLTSALSSIALVPVYVFLFMYYKDHLVAFIIRLFDKKHAVNVSEVLTKIKSLIQKYIIGLLTETSCVAALNCIGLLLIGVPYAILLGIIGALLNLIPYLGGLLAMILTALITLANSGDVYKMAGAMGIYLLVQLIDNNFLVPKVIGSSVRLNALASILAVLIGGAVCGVGGMFLSLPFIAIWKVIFDNVESLKPWGILLGDEEKTMVLKKRKMHKSTVKQ
ncbi:MAG TPA: AI-2E family transporter [Panacibacter sp.]|nr:AI-2E family transporter [Panacibacter sp.]